MTRARGVVASRRRRKKVLKLAKGYYGGRSKLFRTAAEVTVRAQAHAYVGRKRKKGDFRRLWITRISAATRQRGMSYSRFIEGLTKANVQLDRKILSDLAIRDEAAFDKLVAIAGSAAQ